MRTIAMISLTAALLFSGAARAESTETTDTNLRSAGSSGVSAWGILGWGGGLGIGGRYMLPLTSQNLLDQPSIKDRVVLELGADAFRYSYGFLAHDYSWNELLPVVGVAWAFWLDDKFALYPKLDLGYQIGWLSGWDDTWGPTPSHGGFFWQASAGVIYRLSGLSLRGEVGNGLLKAGVGFGF